MNYDLSFSPEDLQLVWNALAELPAKTVRPLLNRLENDIKAIEATKAADAATVAPTP